MRFVSSDRFQQIKRLLDKRQPDLTVVMENVNKAHNLAAIIRTCDAVGIPKVHAVALRPEIRTKQNSASGANRWVDVQIHNSTEDVFSTLRQGGFQIFVAHFSPQATDFRAVDFTKPTALVVGAEWEGISETAISLADGSLYVPMVGMVESLNVSVATAIMLFEAQRQRTEKGFYDKPRLDEATYQRLLFELTYPQIATAYKQKDKALPKMNMDGEILRK
ncbi:tRNA guanosine-2'-O-methyltransferase [Chloroherpeton thalassium ATCC 35110]|uniref:tRNA (guanosine(18)-2'-O)-methyltransferase n=1 Tax=Chloroherpeton thalassium (strain ATCC 35110 / GB-78) TaxID=517418 RepID=B3QXG6_CHLT3|nr:tRNA (guanosine(18)-2'-O)-methyltransferase TrmH [Chloroherpeton thalassium]ACF13440.1 tRNA guanosine-2'-O-methyltransferase [Chloroherpeton thalassium ATCC 35110]